MNTDNLERYTKELRDLLSVDPGHVSLRTAGDDQFYGAHRISAAAQVNIEEHIKQARLSAIDDLDLTIKKTQHEINILLDEARKVLKDGQDLTGANVQVL